MLKKLIRFEDLEGNSVEKEFYFHLSIAELTEWAADGANPGDQLGDQLNRIVERAQPGELLSTFKKLIMRSIGEKNPDGVTFDKTEEITRKFMNTDAYSALLLELVGNANAAAEFVTGIMPAKFQEKVKAMTSDKLELAEAPARPKTWEDYTVVELTNMPYEEFNQLIKKANPGTLPKELLVLAIQRRP